MILTIAGGILIFVAVGFAVAAFIALLEMPRD